MPEHTTVLSTMLATALATHDGGSFSNNLAMFEGSDGAIGGGGGSNQAPGSSPYSTSSGNPCFLCGAWIPTGTLHACGPVQGYSCLMCGNWVPTGTLHVCANLTSSFPRIESKPHLCPVCQGRAAVPFDPDDPLTTSRDRSSWPCKPCGATGVLWR